MSVRLDDEPTRTRFKLRRRRLLPQVRGRDARALAREHCPEACDNTLLIAERCEVEFTEGNGTYMPRFPVPGGRDRGVLVRQGGRDAACAAATPAASPPTVRERADFEIDVILQMGFPGYFLVVADFINWAKDNGIRVGPGRGSGAGSIVRLRDADHRPRPARARPDLRAVPQPRARLDARLRHRLRRASARRGDPLRHREVRRRPRLADRHLRHHQGQAGRQGRQPGPRLPVRDGRPDHQGDAGRGDGQGHPAHGDLRPPAQALRRGRRVPRRSTRPTPTSRPSSTPRSGSRA